MNPLRSRAIRSALVAATIAASTLALAAPAQAATAASCTVEGATLDWGFKESFRAYIDGSIANGEWTTAGDASYATPSFTWSNGTVAIDQTAHTTEATFTGSVRFTGHEGLLDTTIANPVVRIAADGSVTVLLDVSGPTMDGDQVDVRAAEFVTGAADPKTVTASGAQAIVIPAPKLTADGSTAFPNYEAGTAFDDLTLTVPATDDCRVTIAPAVPLWILAGVASGVVLAGVAVFIAVLRQRKTVAGTDA